MFFGYEWEIGTPQIGILAGKRYINATVIDAKSVVRWVANVVTQSFMLIIRNQFQKGIS